MVTIHTLGDLFVPFSMEQVYQKRVAAKGNSDWLVQRAIRGISHCDFTVAEQVTRVRRHGQVGSAAAPSPRATTW